MVLMEKHAPRCIGAIPLPNTLIKVQPQFHPAAILTVTGLSSQVSAMTMIPFVSAMGFHQSSAGFPHCSIDNQFEDALCHGETCALKYRNTFPVSLLQHWHWHTAISLKIQKLFARRQNRWQKAGSLPTAYIVLVMRMPARHIFPLKFFAFKQYQPLSTDQAIYHKVYAEVRISQQTVHECFQGRFTNDKTDIRIVSSVQCSLGLEHGKNIEMYTNNTYINSMF